MAEHLIFFPIEKTLLKPFCVSISLQNYLYLGRLLPEHHHITYFSLNLFIQSWPVLLFNNKCIILKGLSFIHYCSMCQSLIFFIMFGRFLRFQCLKNSYSNHLNTISIGMLHQGFQHIFWLYSKIQIQIYKNILPIYKPLQNTSISYQSDHSLASPACLEAEVFLH